VNAFQQSFHLGTYLVYGGGSLWTNYRFTVTGTYLSTGLAEDIGVMFRYVDANNYYRLALNSRYGFTRLEKKVAGVFTTLASNSRGYRPNEALLFTVDVQGSVISVSVNGDPLFAVADSSIAAGTVALYTQDQAKFDNVVVDEPSPAPHVTIGSPIAYSTSSSDSINVTAYAANVPSNGYVDFVLDGTSSHSDTTAPFSAVFPSVAPGDHQVVAILRNQQGAELARDTNALVGSGGEDIVGIGDSITNGFGDVYATDNLAVAPRIVSFQGYVANLTAQLDTTQFSPANLVTNEGVGGDDTYKAAFVRIASIKARHPTADRALILLGTNDSQAAIPSGLGCAGASCNGTLRGNLQTLIDKVRWADYPTNTVPSGVTPVVARVPPTWTAASPWNSATNNLIRSYNTAISTGLVGANLGPDFFSFFMPSSQPLTFRRTLFRDDLHPNALGYVVMATLWHNALNPSSPLPMPFLLDNFAVSAGAVEPQQNLIENGDPLYVGSGFLVSSIPALLLDGRWIKTSNVDKSNASASYISFSVDRPVQVYIAYDAAASAHPAWLSSYVDTGLTIATDNPLTPTMRLYVKSFPSGPVVLGGNLQSPAVGANANFVAIVVPI
ncbi:MAG TPA: GDSL-type esterase/lipase family protein, partial [Pseudomonadales bacterium]